MSTYVDRREDPRHAPEGLACRINFATGSIVNLSSSGALLETSEWLGLGRPLTLRLSDPALQISGRVVRCQLVRVDPGGRPVYAAGLEFDTSPTVRMQLDCLVAFLAQHRPELVAAVA